MRIVNASTGHAFLMSVGVHGEHRLYWVGHKIVAYEGPMGPRLFVDGVRTPENIRKHLNMLLPSGTFQDFKTRADIRPTKVIDEFLLGLHLEVARDAVHRRLI